MLGRPAAGSKWRAVPRPSGDAGNPAGIGLTVVDNIFVNGRTIRSGMGVEPNPGLRKGDDD